jgi:NAD(P)-dependent dehydrogenase (short-subunit alcohol dehydrogenase family)
MDNSMDAIRDFRPNRDELADRVILITGATRGIGRAAALSCAAHGAQVVVLGRKPKALQALHEELSAVARTEPHALQLDLLTAQGPDYQKLIDAIEERFGRLDGLLHNAGLLGDMSPIEHYDVGTWQKVIHVNLTAVFLLNRCLLPLLKNSKDGSVLFTSSGVGRRGRAFWGAYAVSKFGIEGMMQVMADEYENSGNLRVNCVNPGPVRTEMRRAAFPGEDPDTLTLPEAVLGPYLYLLGPAGRGVNGQSIDCQARTSSR